MRLISLKYGLITACLSPGFFLLALCTPFDDPDLKRNLAFAASQHGVIMNLIEEGKYDAVLPELRKTLDLKLPEKYEDQLTQEICIIGYKLRRKGKEPLALQVLDEGLPAVRLKHNKARLYKEKGYTYRRQGRLG